MLKVFLIFVISISAFASTSKFYGYFSLAFFSNDGRYSLVDNGSRVGVKYSKKGFYPDWTAGLRGEYSVKTTSHNEDFFLKNNELNRTKDNGPFSNRLGYLYLTYDDNFTMSFGKQWSPFYEVTSVTDIFYIFGAETSGAFSLQSDGGYLGSGRANNSARLSYDLGKTKISAIYVATGDQEIEILDADGKSLPGNPKRIYERSLGGAVQYVGNSLTLGFAHLSGNFKTSGATKDSGLTTLGLSYTLGDFTFAQVVTFSKRSEIDDVGEIFDGRGLETTLSYKLSSDVTVAAGLNKLTPDDDVYKNKSNHFYKIEKYIFGLSLKKDVFEAALEGILDRSRLSTNLRTNNNIIGLTFKVSIE